MKKFLAIGFFLILFILFGCSDGSTSSGDNAVVYYGESGMRAVAVIIAEPSAFDEYRAAYTPKTGHLYAIMAPMANMDGPVSAGEVAISGSTITFRPLEDFGFGSQSNFSGTISAESITLNSIPGTSYTNFKVDKIATGRAEDLLEGDVFGGDISFSGNDEDNGNTGDLNNEKPDNGNIVNEYTPGETSYVAGRVVINIEEVYNANNITLFTPTEIVASKNYYWEGQPASLSKIMVKITYDTGDPMYVTNASDFVLDPPEYRSPGTSYTLYYKGDFTGTHTCSITLNQAASGGNMGTSNAFVPFHGTPFKLDASTGLVTPDTATAKLSRQEYYEDERRYTIAGTTLTAKYTDDDAGKARTRAIPINASYNGTLKLKTGAMKSPELWLEIGGAVLHFPITTIYGISNAALETKPSFSLPVLFDDPRLIHTSPYYKEHWASRLNGARLRVSYHDTTPRTVDLIEALCFGYNNASAFSQPSLSLPSDDLTESPFIIIFEYCDIPVEITVPVYDRLVGIQVLNKSSAVVMEKSYQDSAYLISASVEEIFLGKVKISATYQMGSNKSRTAKRDNILVYSATSPITGKLDTYSLTGDAKLETNVDGTLGNTVLTKANSDRYEKDSSKTTKTSVKFITYPSDPSVVGVDTEQSQQYNKFEIGVRGY